MSTKVYHGYRSKGQALNASVEWLRIAMWRKVVGLAKPTSHDEVKSFVENHAEAGIHLWHDPKEDIVLYSLFGLPCFVEKFPKLPHWLREYCYWNNVDLPEGMTTRRWREREKTWNRVALDNGRWDARLTNIVFEKGSFGEWAVAHECLPKMRDHWPGITRLSKRPLPKTIK